MQSAKRRPVDKQKEVHLHVRTIEDRYRRWLKAAKRDERSLSSWVARQLDLAAQNSSG